MCMWLGVDMSSCAQESCWLFSSITLHLTPLRQGLSLNLKFTVYIGLAGQSPWDLPTSATSPASARITYTPAIPRFYMGSEDLNSGPQACTPKTYMHWTISSTPHFVKKKKKKLAQIPNMNPFFILTHSLISFFPDLCPTIQPAYISHNPWLILKAVTPATPINVN